MTNAYTESSNDYNTITLTGKGHVTAIPDISIIRLGVQTTGDNLTATQAENTKNSQSVLQSLKELDITDIETFQYSINKIYGYENGNRIDKGYSVSNILQIKTGNMDQVGLIIDTAIKHRANQVDFINFEVLDPNSHYLQALNLAVMNAYQKAKSIADSLGITINPVPKRITENSSPWASSQSSLARDAVVATPIEPGSKQIEANVTIVYTTLEQ
jgi:uncharacterized protein